MLPTFTSEDIEEGLRSFIEREFPIATPGFRPNGRSIVEEFLSRKENLIKGPWVEIRRPFRVAEADLDAIFPALSGRWGQAKAFAPYAHQLRAYERLAYPNPKPTLVATGTGSGKTECFLHPIVDAVLRINAEDPLERKPGIKAILIYPMNALATDQAKRFAKLCRRIAEAGGPQLTVGLYTGAPGEHSSSTEGGRFVTDRDTLRAFPPDILLTNYKMLDYLLLRDEDRALWLGTGPETLRYLVVDELHAFDGAQGTDLACLVRRLRDRLGLDERLACVGTSATLGGGDGTERLRAYASDVFGADFADEESVVTEDRLSLDEYLASFGDERWEGAWPTRSDAQKLFDLKRSSSVERRLETAYRVWFQRHRYLSNSSGSERRRFKLDLAETLPGHDAFKRLMREAEGVLHLETLAERWRREVEELKGFTTEEVTALLRAFIALISEARVETDVGGETKLLPFLTVRVQFWLRELRRMLATVENRPRLLTRDDLEKNGALALPLVTCRDCNASAWGAAVKDREINPHAPDFYEEWFARHPDARLFYPVAREEYERLRRTCGKELRLLCPVKRRLEWIDTSKSADEVFGAEACPVCAEAHEPLIVRMPNTVVQHKDEEGRHQRRSTRCPMCGSENSMRILGARSVTLSAALTGHLHASDANDDRKLICFSDSVQDAAHRAGFLGARSFLFAVRQAVAGLVRDENSERDDFATFLSKLEGFLWEKVGGRTALLDEGFPEADAERIAAARFVATFIPSDLASHWAWRQFEGTMLEKRPDEKDEKTERAAVYGMLPELRTPEGEPTPWGVLLSKVASRLRWEAFVEMSLRSHAGRTVEMAGIAAVAPEARMVDEVVEKLLPLYREHVGGLRDVTEEALRRFVMGVLLHEKYRGAFDVRNGPAETDAFAQYVKTGDDYRFNLSGGRLPTYGRKYSPPAPLMLRRLRSGYAKFFDVVLDLKDRNTWYTLWCAKVFGDGPDITAACGEIYERLFDALVEREGMSRTAMEDGESVAYLLTPASWRVERRLARVVCPKCGRWHFVAADEASLWRDMPCLSKDCMGRNHRVESVSPDESSYRGTPVRLQTKEHTANIEHTERGHIEKSFIKGTEPWDVNFLSATPTLEMGIDIGDLSSVLLSSMPPEPANFVQRIGRAGRRDGNALAMTVCGTDPHSQYFWASPEKMLEGEVEPPGVFLHAMAVMERQLFAFAVSRWMENVTDAKVPDRIGALLRTLEAGVEKGYGAADFPFGLLDFVEDHAEGLLDDFARLFTAHAPEGEKTLFRPEERRRLLTFLKRLDGIENDQPTVRERLLGKLRRLLSERKRYEEKRRAFRSAWKELEKRPDDEKTRNDMAELQANELAVAKLIEREFDEKSVLNVLTDEGVLPNYAFPEEGIALDGLVMRVRSRGSDGTPEAQPTQKRNSAKNPANNYKRLTFQRAASTGLFEIAPGNTFYSNDYALHVDQVDLAQEKVVKWRFCPSCPHCEPDAAGERGSACPRCGDPAWRAEAQCRPLLNVRTVYAYADLRKDRIRDDREDRMENRQARVQLVDIDPRVERRSFVTERGEGFGFEYLPSAELRDFNFGRYPKSGEETDAFEIASTEVSAPGFCVCAHCGRIAAEEVRDAKGNVYRKGREPHDLSCAVRRGKKKEEWIRGLVLSRSFKSEVLRIRVPQGVLTEAHAPAVVEASLAAALRLGLKRYYRGSVDHLVFREMREPVPGTKHLQSYIVVCDTVPGGTGYLKELLEAPEKLLGVLRSACEALTECTCGDDPEADGCYRCLFRYGDARKRDLVSKRCALDVLNLILEDAHTLKKGSIDVSGGLAPYDSELERRFLVALKKAEGGVFRTVRRNALGGGLFYYLLERHDGFVWRVDLQEDVGGERPSRPDFVIRPYREEDQKPELRMAVFTDGWTYHAPIVREDCAKRQSLLNDGWRVWTLYWDDVAPYAEEDAVTPTKAAPAGAPVLAGVGMPDRKMYEKCVEDQKLPSYADLESRWLRKSSFERLLVWLSEPEFAEKAGRATVVLGSLSIERHRLRKAADEAGGALAPVGMTVAAKELWLAGSHFEKTSKGGTSFGRSLMRFSSKPAALLAIDAERIAADPNAKDDFELRGAVRNFWDSANAAQFGSALLLFPEGLLSGGRDGAVRELADSSPWKRAVRRFDVRGGLSEELSDTSDAPTDTHGGAADAATADTGEAVWEAAKSLLPDALHPLADRLRTLAVPVDPGRVGVDLAGDDEGGVLVTAELFWPEAHLAVILEEGSTDVERRIGDVRCLNGIGDAEALARRIAGELCA